MLNYVDTLIGFSGVMLLLSLLVTAIVQAAIAVLKMRGECLRWGVELLVKRAIPALKDHEAKALADDVLTHETLSHDESPAKAITSRS